MRLPAFTAEAAVYQSFAGYAMASLPLSSDRLVAPQLPFAKALACAVYAGLCLAASEDPPAAAYCWWDFASRCGGGSA